MKKNQKLEQKKDILYCWVREEKIKFAKPKLNKKVIKEWFFHQRERTKIYYKKEILKQKSPWTKDEILQKYKFVNTKRKWDKETKWLLKNIIENNNLTYDEKLLNCVLFRVINKWETFNLFWGAIKFFNENIDFYKIRQILENKSKTDDKYVFFSAAYILWWPKVNFWKYIEKKEWKVEKNMILRMLKFVNYEKNNIVNWIKKSKTQKEVCEFLETFSWIWEFLSYQMFIDMTYLEDFPFTEHNFVISWPWCARWLNWIFEDKDWMTDEECLFWFVENQFKIANDFWEEWDLNKVFHFLPKEERIYTLMDMENSWACEIDKRCRTLFSGKRPKQIYRNK